MGLELAALVIIIYAVFSSYTLTSQALMVYRIFSDIFHISPHKIVKTY